MIGKDDVRDFLMSRRANVTPGQAGLPQDGGDRRVPGLRREEVAMLAGVSTDYYTRLERGDIGNASRSVLEGIARALQLDDVERDHLFDLARNATSDATGHDDTPRSGSVRESVQRLLDNMQVPAVVYNAHQDLVAANLLGRALFAPIFETRATEPGPLHLPRRCGMERHFPLLQAHLPHERVARVQQRYRRRTFVSRDGVRSATCGATAEAATGLDR